METLVLILAGIPVALWLFGVVELLIEGLAVR